MKKTKYTDWVFECRKCGHNLFVGKKDILLIFRKDCPECGEEPERNWTILRQGNFDKEYK